MPFQSTVYTRPAPGILGDFASDAPRFYYAAGPGGLVAGPSGVTVGRFAWASPSTQDWDAGPTIVNSFFNGVSGVQGSTGQVTGFVHREQQALITAYLAESGLVVPQGFMVKLLTGGDIWIKNEGATQCVPGMTAYAAYATGAVNFAAASSPLTGPSGSTSSVAASTFSVTGSISGNVLTVTAVSSGTIYPGATISGTGITTNSMIVTQLSGTAGGVGVYTVSIGEQSAASTTVSGTYGTLTVAGTVVTGFAVGQLLSGTGVAAGTYVTALISGTGGAGTYAVSNNTVVSSTAISGYTSIATKWYALSAGAAGELVRCASQALG